MINLNLILLDLVWICGFSMSYQYDNDSMVGVLLLYIRYNIPTKFLKHYFGTNIENLSAKINLQKRKWFFNGPYNLHKNKLLNHLNYLNFACSKYKKVYDNFILMAGSNVEMRDKGYGRFLFSEQSCIDLILT